MEEQLFQVTEDTWAIVLGLAVRPHSPATVPAEALFTGWVEIAGAWKGRLLVGCSESLTRRFASIMYAKPAAELAEQHCRDALGELANIIAGNVKALLPGDTEISPPTVTEEAGAWHVPDAGQVSEVAVDCEGELVRVAFCVL